MPSSEDSGPMAPASAGGRRLDLVGKRLGVIGAVLCGVLILALVATIVLGFTAEGTSGGMALGILYFFFIPLASIPVGLVCLAGAVVSGVALRRQSSPAARTGLELSLLGPAVVLTCYLTFTMIVIVFVYW